MAAVSKEHVAGIGSLARPLATEVSPMGLMSLAERRAFLFRRRRGSWWLKALPVLAGTLVLGWIAMSLFGLLQPLAP